jgi:hypothetical protein
MQRQRKTASRGSTTLKHPSRETKAKRGNRDEIDLRRTAGDHEIMCPTTTDNLTNATTTHTPHSAAGDRLERHKRAGWPVGSDTELA